MKCMRVHTGHAAACAEWQAKEDVKGWRAGEFCYDLFSARHDANEQGSGRVWFLAGAWCVRCIVCT